MVSGILNKFWVFNSKIFLFFKIYLVFEKIYFLLKIIKMNQMRIVISRIPACSIVALMFMLIGIIVLSISLSSFFDKIGENIFIDYGFM